MSLNNDIIAKIVSQADVPIDTYLAFRNIGVIPKRKKLEKLNLEFKQKLDKYCSIRSFYKTLKKINNHYSIPLYEDRQFITIETDLTINCDDEIELSLSIIYSHHQIYEKVYTFAICDQDDYILRQKRYLNHTGTEI